VGVIGTTVNEESTMHRRKFLAATGASMALASSDSKLTALGGEGEPSASQIHETPRKSKPVKMKVGTQRGPTTPQMLQFIKRHGVDHLCGYPPLSGDRGHWTVEELQQTRDLCEQHGLSLDIVALPFLTSSHIDREKRGAIMLGQSPERDRDIEDIQKMIAGCAQVGIPCIKYNMSLLGVLRTEPTEGRGGSSYSTWRRSEARADPPLTRAGRVTEDDAWERISYFLERVIPVCEEYKIRFACHPHDPGVPREGFQGIYRVLGTFEGLRKFISIAESPYHGLNFCVGTIAENLDDPANEIHEVIRYFGERKKIFNIHFRNIIGRRDDFQEVYLDNGDMDMLQVARTLHEVDYEFMVMPDHVPRHSDDPGSLQGFAFSYGYIKALLAAIEGLG
jgi:mannonate dehydratase